MEYELHELPLPTGVHYLWSQYYDSSPMVTNAGTAWIDVKSNTGYPYTTWCVDWPLTGPMTVKSHAGFVSRYAKNAAGDHYVSVLGAVADLALLV